MRWSLSQEEQQALLALRREFHRHPELSWQEVRTSARVFEELCALGLAPRRVADLGVIADLGAEGPMVVLRADMDALPIDEDSGVPFASENPGIMHACGHDAHTACLLAAARRLVAEPPPAGRVRFLFQPGEETAAGAERLIEEGALRDPVPVAIYGAHVWSQMPTGKVGVHAGPTMGSVDRFEILVKGKGGHGACPEQTADPIVAAAQLVTSLQTLVSRRIDPLASVVVTVGQFEAGTAFNIIPDTARLVGTVRTLERESWEQIPTLLDEIVLNSVRALGCEASIELTRLQRPLINHPRETEIVREAALRYVDAHDILPLRMLAGEDFASYLELLPGCFFFVGASHHKDSKSAMQSAPHHNPAFLLDEDAFALVARILEDCARIELQRQTS